MNGLSGTKSGTKGGTLKCKRTAAPARAASGRSGVVGPLLPRSVLLPPRAMTAADWNGTTVWAWIVEAVDTLTRLPKVSGPGVYRSSMPMPVREMWKDMPAEPRMATFGPSSDAIDRLDRVLAWMTWFGEDRQRLIWARAAGLPWRVVQGRFGFGRRWGLKLLTETMLRIAETEKTQNSSSHSSHF